ncbi:hypothetical protein BH11PSE12_BH11PSE12_27600 [soil metagenome]
MTENSLLGSWVRVKNGFFEEMNFSIRQEKKVFLSWIHHRPEMSGTWGFSQCVIAIQNTGNETLQFDVKVQKIVKDKLYVVDTESNLNAVYKKIQPTPPAAKN